jgi:hypothetical protein
MFGTDWIDLAQEGSYEDGNEPVGSVTRWEVLQ